MKRRKDYLKFKEILDQYQIKKFYHFTDRANIESIVKSGGLYSWGDCIKKGIYVVRPGGSELSRNLDRQENLQDYTRISLCKRHPMMYYAMNDGRIANPVILEIDTDILYQEGNIFSDKNAVRADANKGSSFSDFENLHFQTALRNTPFEVDEDEKDYFQAEILVKNHIPLHYILNISDFIERDTSCSLTCVKSPYSAQITEENPAAVIFILNQSFPTNKITQYKGIEKKESQVLCDIVNQQIQSLLAQNTDSKMIHNRYEIAVIGYGDCSYSCFEGNLQYKGLVGLTDLSENPICCRKIIKEKKTRKGVVQLECNDYIWIKPHSDGNAYLHKALEQAKRLAETWISLHPYSYPPIIVHISGYGYNGVEDSKIIQIANEIKSLYTNDGNVLLTNLIYSTKPGEKSIMFPESIYELDGYMYGEMYYLMSSQLPLSYNQLISEYRENIGNMSYRTALTFKTDISTIPSLLRLCF